MQDLSWLGSNILWLASDDARHWYEHVDRLQSERHYGFDPTRVDIGERIKCDEATPDWLRRRIPIQALVVLIVFGDEEVCQLPTSTLVAEWENIFVPGRDDAIILEPDSNWVLYYHHENEFEFGLVSG
jgi:hypothetical protein